MEVFLNSNKKRIFAEVIKDLVRHSASYKQAKKSAFEKPSFEGKQVLEKNILSKSNFKSVQTTPSVVPLISERKMSGGIDKVASELKAEKFEISSLKPMPQKREINRPALQQARVVIPEQKLPLNLQYLQPTPTDKGIDLGKLNPLMNDQMVKIIDCPGPDQNIVVTGNMGTKKTGIILGRDEISDVIDKFSKESKIPVNEGVFKVVVGRFIFLAIVSEIIGSRFTIKKMIAAPGLPQRR
ncbi:MAG: hypothetical protein AABX93_03015 [Nanoarchaeota archaeon]